MSNNFSDNVYVSHVHVSQKRKAWNPAVPNPTINQLAAARFRHIGDAFFCSANVTRSSNSAVVMLKLSALIAGQRLASWRVQLPNIAPPFRIAFTNRVNDEEQSDQAI
ncbi:uncharacterized protein PGTG_04608 [Puccinia graminis f. sp. tritici CRL 75-36-700-3]|uniref:Uncharacterized protein n=1 Tax=Puccinia graminis f. sp. tritici (strain CRL 75-36-700-3 / race SCCL) TaxID=418459 RepID=E3K2T2_PUCGT|nr:uncharacterized protein PGTG_04608 [Puccinia graminis f. sp. tritici CRL 75-36-700-3]EFP78652.1 hypothetical protein PGTG_04608 [Puccinia graminis f. sp. tritici CRL 75-36-700-3]